MQITTILIWSFIPPLIMLLWVWALRFPQTWILKVCLAFEVLVILLVLLIEIDARQTSGNGGWMMIFFTIFQIYLGVGLGAVRLVKPIKLSLKKKVTSSFVSSASNGCTSNFYNDLINCISDLLRYIPR